MTLPNFLVIGSGKAGTSSIGAYLDQHPQVFMSPVKEPNFFAYDAAEPGILVWGSSREREYPVRDLTAYAALFDGVRDEVAIGEASTVYLESRDAPPRIRATLPGVRLVASLRDPVDRAYSSYWMGIRLGTESRDIGQALHPGDDLVRAGFYHSLLQRYVKLFERERLHVLLFDDLRSRPVEAMQSLYRFLEVDGRFVPDVRVRHNVGGVPRSRMLHTIFASRGLRAVARPLLRGRLRQALVGLRQRSLRRPPPLPEALRRSLIALYREDVLRLQQLLERDLSHWLE